MKSVGINESKRRTCRDGIRKACEARLLELRDAKVKCMDRGQWKNFMHSVKGDMNVYSKTDHTFDAKQ